MTAAADGALMVGGGIAHADDPTPAPAACSRALAGFHQQAKPLLTLQSQS